jgi:hypothetical protein
MRGWGDVIRASSEGPSVSCASVTVEAQQLLVTSHTDPKMSFRCSTPLARSPTSYVCIYLALQTFDFIAYSLVEDPLYKLPLFFFSRFD